MRFKQDKSNAMESKQGIRLQKQKSRKCFGSREENSLSLGTHMCIFSSGIVNILAYEWFFFFKKVNCSIKGMKVPALSMF